MSQQQQPPFRSESQFEQQPQTAAMGGAQTGQVGSQGYYEGVQPGIDGGGQQPTIVGQQGIQTSQWSQQQPSSHHVGGMDLKLDQALTDEMRVALHDFVQSANVCEWCAERCADHGPEMSECLRLCRDVADLASLNVKLLTRDSVFGPEAAEVFITAADACARECATHQHSHCQECSEVLFRAVESVQKMLASFQEQQMGIQTARPTGGAVQTGQQVGQSVQPQMGQQF